MTLTQVKDLLAQLAAQLRETATLLESENVTSDLMITLSDRYYETANTFLSLAEQVHVVRKKNDLAGYA